MTVAPLNHSKPLCGPDVPYDLHTSTESFEQLAQWVGEYGDVFPITQKTRKAPALFVNDPDVIKHILIKNNRNYLKGVGFERVKMLLGNGIIVSDGPFWRRQRRMIQPAFGREVIAELTSQIKKLNLELLDRWQRLAAQSATINITEETNELALQIILRSLFSDDLDRIFEEQQGNPFSILTDDSARDLKLAVKFRGLTRIVGELIARRRQQRREYMDFVSSFMAARDKDTGEPMTDKELIDEVMTLIVAGSETSATTFNWTWYSLSQYPEVLATAQQEVDHAGYEKVPGFGDMEALPYIHQLVGEVLRVYPPVWLFTRKAIARDEVKGINIAPETDIFISPYFMHRHPDYWPQPEHFDPRRFTESAIKSQHKTAYLPFSAGPRRCIGDFFAMVESQLHFGLMLRHITMEYVADHPIELAPEVNLRTRYPISMRLHQRNKNSP
ncbi:MAG: cytochrome P450 [Gammaproteobacteria bacterium]